MSLTELWRKNPGHLKGKQIHQIIAFAGDGQLRDDGLASREFRDFLSRVSSNQIQDYISQCLQGSFHDSGYALQDLVNQIGRRLGFQVSDGRYRGKPDQPGYDGLWQFPGGHTVVIEVKTTDTYRITLDTIAQYRRQLIAKNICTEENSSILIVLGRTEKATRDLEAQIRGSRHAWSIRLISVQALTRLLFLKEDVEDPQIINRISKILIPYEYTKLDEIIELVFSAAEDIRQEDAAGEGVPDEPNEHGKQVSFQAACIERIEQKRNLSFLRHSRALYRSPDNTTRLMLAISKPHQRSGQTHYWFAFHPHQRIYLEDAQNRFVAFGCGSEKNLVFIPLDQFAGWLDQMSTTEKDGRVYWHVKISQHDEELTLHGKQGGSKIDLSPFRLS